MHSYFQFCIVNRKFVNIIFYLLITDNVVLLFFTNFVLKIFYLATFILIFIAYLLSYFIFQRQTYTRTRLQFTELPLSY